MPQLSVIVPTFNEAGNVAALKDAVAAALSGIDWELVFVDDDSPDDTIVTLRAMAQADPRVRCIQRIGRRGLSSACLEGMLSSSSPLVAVIDADHQHDETLLPRMVELLAGGELDLVVGSRYVADGSIGAWGSSRAAISRVATRLSRWALKVELHDPMSGFFMIRHDRLIDCVRAGVSGVGFKILLDLFASSPRPLRVRELPYRFRDRAAGESKLDSYVAWQFAIMLLDRFLGGVLPARFIAFSIVGGVGLLVHLAVLALLFKGAEVSFLWAQTAATLVAMTSNYVLNNVLTYRDMRLRGWAFVRGWVSFVVACSVGALANVGIADHLFQGGTLWFTSAVAGVVIGAVWNYAVTAVYTWRSPRRSKR
ncbi:MAG: glycosyltransferase family 2 protein [Caldimonas sp.]